MPPLDDNDQVSDPSDETALDAAPDPTVDNDDPDAGASGADSSDAQGDNDGPSTLDIVRDVVGLKRPEAASPAEGQEDGSKPGEPEAQSTEQDDEEYSDVPFHKHPRFQQLLRKAKSNESDAVRYRNVQSFLDTNGISAEEAADGFTIMAAMKTDAVKAWEMLKPHVQKLLHAAGEVLPDDLAQQVQSGAMSLEAAQQVARANARVQAVETSRTFEQQRAERMQAQQTAQAVQQAAVDWEADRQTKDPNYPAKQQLLMREVALLQRTEGVPNSPQGVKDQLDRAYKAIVLPATVRPAAPPPPTVGQGVQKAKPTASGSASGNARPAPKTTLDIINQVVAKRKAG